MQTTTRRMASWRGAILLPITLAGLTFATTAGATGAMEVPDNGSEQMARGGAWLARASDPEAALYNPAGLAGQPTALTFQGNLVFNHTCFTRTKALNDTTQDGVAAGGSYGRTCNDISPSLNPNFAFNYHATDRLGLAVGIFTPSAASSSTFPEFVNGKQASPNRYLLNSFNGTILSPTIAAGYELLPGWRVGASFEWTLATLKLSNASQELNQGGVGSSPASNDARAAINVKDLFVPGFTLGTIYSPIKKLDIAAWYKWSAPIDASGNLTAAAGYYGTGTPTTTDVSKVNCGGQTPNAACGPNGPGASFKVNVPQEAKIGFRWHQPRHDIEQDPHLRDPMSQDIYDIELDLTYANDSAIDNFQIRLPGQGTILLNGTPGYIPPNADVPHMFHDVFGARLGGDWNIIPDKLALRAGAYTESAAMRAVYQNIDFPDGPRIGWAGGAAYRIHFAKIDGDTPPGKRAAKTLEIMVGFMHTLMFSSSTQDGQIKAIAGTQCQDVTQNNAGAATCKNGLQSYRTTWSVNNGTITNAVNLINLGVNYRF